MFLDFIITLTGASAFLCVALIVRQLICSQLALRRFKKLSRGLPMYPHSNPFGNHAVNIMMGYRTCQKLQKYHEEMGKTIGWLRRDDFGASTIDLDLIKVFIKDEPGAHLGRIPIGLAAAEFEESIMTAPAEEWPEVRRAIAPALAPNKFKTPNVQLEVEESIGKLIGFIERRLDPNEPDRLFDVDDFVGRFAASLVAKCFYKQDDLIDFENPNDLWVKMIEDASKALNEPFLKNLLLNFSIFIGLVDWISLHFTTVGLCRRTVLQFVKDQTLLAIEARKRLRELKREAKEKGLKLDSNDFLLEDGTRFRRNMIDYVIDQYLDGKLSKKQYVNNSCFIMAAANRTASDCILHTIYLLSIDQQVQEKLRESIRKDGADSEYLDWVLKESLRLLPPAPIGCSRTVTRDIELPSGHLLPKGTFVFTNSFVIHRLKEYWGEDAEEFRPERWRNTSHHHPMQYLPFGAGPRGCPGKQFAMHAIKMLFEALLTRYKFTGKVRDDAYEFDSPLNMFILPNSSTRIKISRV